jgi:LysM repeat protein
VRTLAAARDDKTVKPLVLAKADKADKAVIPAKADKLAKASSPSKDNKAAKGKPATTAALSKNDKSAGKKAETKVSQHVVQPNETLYRVATRYDISVDQLRRINGLGKDNSIRPGQRLRVSI